MRGRTRKIGGEGAAIGARPLAATTITPSIRLEFPGPHRLGPGKIALLERIMETGSIAAAGRRMKMSYRRAWVLVGDINRMFAEPIVIAAPGGPNGGGAEVTALGRRLVTVYRAIEAAVAIDANHAFAEFRIRPRSDGDHG